MVFFPAIAMALAFAQQGLLGADLPAKYQKAPPSPDSVVAKVGGVEIKASDVESLLWEWRGIDAVQDLVSYQLIRAEAQKQRVDVSEAEIEDALTKGLESYAKNVPQGASVDDYLLSQGMTRSRLYLRIRTQKLMDKMVERTFDPKNLVKVETIVFAFREDGTATAATAKQADDAYAQLKKDPGSWQKILATTTTNQQVISSNGLLGWRDLSAFPEAIRSELKGLAIGGITKPVRVQNNMQIFKLVMLGKDAKNSDFDEMKRVYLSVGESQLIERLKKETPIERLYPKKGTS